MSWHVTYLEAAQKDLEHLDQSQRIQVLKAIEKVSADPTPDGYGKPLGSKGGSDLHGLMKIKLRKSGLRVVYQLVYDDSDMRIIVIGVRSDAEVYRKAAQRLD